MSDFIPYNANAMVVGVSNFAREDEDDPGNPARPTIMSVARNPAQESKGDDTKGTEPDTRARVRVRTSVTLCTPITSQPGVGALLDISVSSNAGDRSAQVANGNAVWKLSDGMQFSYCTADRSLEK